MQNKRFVPMILAYQYINLEQEKHTDIYQEKMKYWWISKGG